MTRFSLTTSLVLTALVGTASLLPAAPALADTPNSPNNATVAAGSSGNYDGFDRFRDETGRPRQGWQYLFNSAS